jgi:L-fucose isomerase-like protein
MLVPVVSSLHESKSVERVVSSYRDWLEGAVDGETLPVSELGRKDRTAIKGAVGLLVLVVTGGTERLIQTLAATGPPVLILAHESMNSLPAALESLSSLYEASRPQLLFGKDAWELKKVREFTEAARAFAGIRGHRLGSIGGPSPWLTYSRPNREALSRRLGIRLIDITMSEFRRAYENADRKLVAELAADARSKGQSIDQFGVEEFERATKIYLAIKSIAARHDLGSVSLKCFDSIKEFKIAGCYAVARLNDDGFVAGCEGDVPATAAMIVLSKISKQPCFLGNASFVREHELVLAHCTIAPTLTTKYQYRTHFESGLGIAIAGSLRNGERVTVARFSKELDTLRVGEGFLVKGDAWSDELCRTQLEIRMDGNAETVKDHPLGNHYVITYGEHLGTLRNLAAFAGIKLEEM